MVEVISTNGSLGNIDVGLGGILWHSFTVNEAGIKVFTGQSAGEMEAVPQKILRGE